MQIRFFLSPGSVFQEKVTDRGIYPPSYPEASQRFLLIRETKFHGSMLAIRQLSQFTKHSVFLETAGENPADRYRRTRASFAISFYFLLCITRLMVGLYPAVEKNTSCKNLKTLDNSVLMVRISFRFRGFAVTTLRVASLSLSLPPTSFLYL